MRAIAYLRWSTDKQDLSEDAQRKVINDWARAQGAEIALWCIDAAVSGSTPIDERQGLTEALSALHDGDTLVVAKRDRLARDVITSAMVHRLAEKAGADVTSADGLGNGNDPAAELFRTIIDAMAQYERQLTRQRTKAALQAKRARGEAAGGTPPYGWRRRGNEWVPDDHEQQGRDLIRELRSQGLSLAAISEELEDSGFKNRKGRPLGAKQVARILKYVAHPGVTA